MTKRGVGRPRGAARPTKQEVAAQSLERMIGLLKRGDLPLEERVAVVLMSQAVGRLNGPGLAVCVLDLAEAGLDCDELHDLLGLMAAGVGIVVLRSADGHVAWMQPSIAAQHRHGHDHPVTVIVDAACGETGCDNHLGEITFVEMEPGVPA